MCTLESRASQIGRFPTVFSASALRRAGRNAALSRACLLAAAELKGLMVTESVAGRRSLRRRAANPAPRRQ
jgi:hypothetical protein